MLQEVKDIARTTVTVDPARVEMGSLELDVCSFPIGPHETEFQLSLGGQPLEVDGSAPHYKTRKEVLKAYDKVRNALETGRYRLEFYDGFTPKIHLE